MRYASTLALCDVAIGSVRTAKSEDIRAFERHIVDYFILHAAIVEVRKPFRILTCQRERAEAERLKVRMTRSAEKPLPRRTV